MGLISTFLEQYRPDGPWWLVAIRDGTLRGSIFDSAASGEEWAIKHNKDKWNIYYHINPHIGAPPRPKALKEHIAQVEWMYADIDPDPKKEINGEQARLLQLASGSNATLAVFSGNGVQLLWRLDGSRPVGPEIEGEILSLATLLGGDSVHNADRVFRLPGSWNWPNKRKQELGREPAEARVIHFNDSTHDVTSVLAWARGVAGAPKKPEPEQPSGAKEDFDANSLPDDVLRKVEELSEECGKPGTDRSRTLWRCCHVLLRGGISEDTALRVITSRRFAFVAHLQTRRDSYSYARRHVRRVWDEDSDPRIASLNQLHFYADEGTKPFIWEIKEDGRAIPKSPAAFLMRYQNKSVEYEDTEGKTKSVPLGKYWLEHPRRRSYSGGVIFDPSCGRDPNAFNTFDGLPIVPVAGESHLPWLEHLTDTICKGDSTHAHHVLSWLAAPLQAPGRKLGTSIILRGDEGSGKGTFVRPIGLLYGRHYQHIYGIEGIIGRFNSHLEDKLLIYADEAIWGGLKGSVGTINALITESVLNVERKHSDMRTVRNHANFIFASNADWVVPATGSARRYFVLDVNKEDQKKEGLRESVNEQLDADPEAFLANLYQFLLEYDVSDFKSFFAPKTDALKRQQREGWNVYQQFAFEILDRGWIGPRGTWPSRVETDEVWNEFMTFSRGGMFSRNSFIGELRRLVKGSRYREFLKLPPLQISRDEFEKRAGGVERWSEPPSAASFGEEIRM